MSPHPNCIRLAWPLESLLTPWLTSSVNLSELRDRELVDTSYVSRPIRAQCRPRRLAGESHCCGEAD